MLWVVDGEQDKPRSEPAEVPSEGMALVVEPAVDAALAPIPHAPVRARQPATSRRVVAVPDLPLEEPQWREEPSGVPAAVPANAAPITELSPVRTLDPPLPRHRLRSVVLLIGLVVLIGALVAVVVGVVATALALALRAAVTS